MIDNKSTLSVMLYSRLVSLSYVVECNMSIVNMFAFQGLNLSHDELSIDEIQ
jgi:hypothetical protein